MSTISSECWLCNNEVSSKHECLIDAHKNIEEIEVWWSLASIKMSSIPRLPSCGSAAISPHSSPLA